jgi:hypothetical protein
LRFPGDYHGCVAEPRAKNMAMLKIFGNRSVAGRVLKFSPIGYLWKRIALGNQLRENLNRQPGSWKTRWLVNMWIECQNIIKHSDAKVPFHIKVVDTDRGKCIRISGGFFCEQRFDSRCEQ